MKTKIISIAIHLIALVNNVEWKFVKMKPSARRELRKLREHYRNQAKELEEMIIDEKEKNIKELKSQLKSGCKNWSEQ